MSCSSVRIVASWDTRQRLTYGPNAPRKHNINPIPNPNLNPNFFTPLPPVTLTAGTNQSIFDRLKRPSQVAAVKLGEDQSYLGCERWLPSPPKVEKPRSVYNATTLAYIGDCIYELYARRHFLLPQLSIEEYNERVMAVVRCEAQDAFLQKLLDDDYLSKEERDVLRWGKNIISSKTRTKRRAGGAVYNRASSLETLVGYLYLTNANRLEEVMLKLGFCTDSSSHMILEDPIVGKQDSH